MPLRVSRSRFVSPAVVSEYPNASNTGVPAGTSLTAYSGPQTITTNGTIIDGKIITLDGIGIQASNVIIRNSFFDCPNAFYCILWESGTNLQILDCEIDGNSAAVNDSGVGGDNITIRRCNIHHCGDGIKAGYDCVVEDNYIHDLTINEGGHNDNVQSLGTDSLIIRHNTLICADTPGMGAPIILSTGLATDMRNVLIEDNLLAGGNVCCYGGYDAANDPPGVAENIQILNNKISTQVFLTGGVSGVFTNIDSPVVVSGNVWYDGPNQGTSADDD